MNLDSQHGLHVDDANDGLAAIVALGPFEGGRLLVIPPSSEPRLYDLQGKWVVLEPLTAHGVESWRGTRASLVAYWRDPSRCLRHDYNFLLTMGFALEKNRDWHTRAVPGPCRDRAEA
jgi:hypothetical protein